MKRRHLTAFAGVLITLAALVVCESRPQATTSLKPCPISLTNPDGQEMALEKYDLRVAVDGPLSLTEMEMVFRNPKPKQMEGRFLYLLPPGATISRFAKEVNGNLMEGEVVERLRAQAIYTEILQSMRDPALLEMDQGNRFSARVFPIPAGGTVRLLLSYSQRVPSDNGVRKVTIPLAGIPKIGEFTYSLVVNDLPGQKLEPVEGFDVSETAAERLKTMRSIAKKDFVPQADLTFAFKSDANAPAIRAIHAGDYQMIAWRPEVKIVDAEEAIREWTFYFDTSASNADMEKRRLEAIDQIVSKIHDTKQRLSSAFAFDVEVKPLQVVVHDQPGTYGPDSIVDQLRSRHALGATNMEVVLKHIGEQARAAKTPQRFVLVADGIATLGSREIRDLLAALGDWPEQHVLHALVIGSKQDEKTLTAIVEKTHGRVVTLPLNDEMDSNVPKVISELTRPIGRSYEFYDESADWIYPKTFRDVKPGSEMIVFSQLKKGSASKAGAVTRGMNNKPVDTQLVTTAADVADFAPLLKREACAAYLDHLEKLEATETKPEKIAEMRKLRVELSTKNRVLCPLTSLLVLENEWDYQRFGIDRTSLADVMVVGANGIEMKARKSADLQLQAMTKPQAVRHAPRKSADAEKSKELAADVSKLGAATPANAKADSETDDLVDGTDARRQLGGGRALRSRGSDGEYELKDAKDAMEQAQGGSGGAGDEGLESGATRIRSLSVERLARSEDRAAAAPAGAQPPAPPAVAPIVAAAQQEQQASANGQPISGFAGNREAAGWANQEHPPTAQQLQMLHEQVAGDPRNRALRNAYASALYRAKKWDELQGQAFEWMPFDPENPQVYEFLGKSATGLKDFDLALRAMTSIAEIAPNRAALLSRAGWLLLTAEKYEMAEQMFREALKNRKDDCNIYRGLALTLWLSGKYDVAAKELADAIKIDFNPRYGDVRRVLREELAYVIRAWATVDAPAAGTFAQKNGMETDLQRTDAFRASLCWETDANDVDLHVIDPNNEECYYSHMHNVSGLELYSDQTQGLGPEVIRTAKTIPGKYYVGVNYFASGPMGVSRGVVVVMKPENGIVKKPEIVPFCLIPEGSDMRLITTINY